MAPSRSLILPGVMAPLAPKWELRRKSLLQGSFASGTHCGSNRDIYRIFASLLRCFLCGCKPVDNKIVAPYSKLYIGDIAFLFVSAIGLRQRSSTTYMTKSVFSSGESVNLRPRPTGFLLLNCNMCSSHSPVSLMESNSIYL